jgi:hypothetical protein
VSGNDAAPAVSENAIIGGSAWEGIRAVLRSRYLLAMASYLVIPTLMGTFICLTQPAGGSASANVVGGIPPTGFEPVLPP